MASPNDTEIGRRRLALAPQVMTYVDYLAYSEILQTPNRARKLEMIEQAMQASPKSAYIPAMRRLTLAIWREIDPQKAISAAEKMIEKDPTNEEALIMVAESYVQRDKDPEKALAYGEKVIALMEQTAKVEGIPDAEWSKKRAGLTGRANWLIGSISMQRGNFSQADKAIRAALPYLKGDLRLVSTALFYLGWANYQTGNISEAIRFNQDCTRIRGPYQEQAFKNLAVIQSENPAQPIVLHPTR
jgi:tetratricopeptide (TPR) repeat protein